MTKPPTPRKGAPPRPGVNQAAHKILQQGKPPGTPQPKPGHHPLGGANASTVVSDSGMNQQQQLQDKGGQ